MFSKILIANRGEIARRIARTCKRMGIATVAVYSDADEHAPHVLECDEKVRLGPAAVKESYLNADAIVVAAQQTGAQAIHPGYGLLSEKGDFARKVIKDGMVFIGPPPDVLDKFGNKMLARHVAIAANVPPVPGDDTPMGPEELGRAKSAAHVIGYPLVVKAVGGGGGIGMQVVRDDSQIDRAVKACSDRGAQAFADARVYMERYIERPRHIEVQIFCDAHGNAVALGERECSVQRRHQKIVEETPSPLLVGPRGEKGRKRLFERALAVVKSVGYVGAGTVEFIMDGGAPDEPFFLEVNARLQVEHPVTELVRGLDLVEAQIRVAAGEPMPKALLESQPCGHAIEVRVYAEEPRKGFLPRPGAVDVLEWPAPSEGIRIDSGVEAGSKVTPYYDPMIAKMCGYGANREEAIARLDAALAQTKIAPCVTNVEFLRDVLHDDRFRAGEYDTLFAEALAKAPQKPR
jgi:acetyl-CoA carboxylase biotin carboxylase subunit/3-methylcrotonyl-CoA carboxylase alpha subunit